MEVRHNIGLSVAIFMVLQILFPFPAQSSPRFELLHLWGVDIEQHALAAISEPAKEKGVNWNEQIVTDNFAGIISQFAQRHVIGNPPEGAFWIGGHELKEFIDDGLARAITQDMVHPDFDGVLIPEIRSQITMNEGYSLLPLVIHLQSHAVYNREILDKYALPTPTTWAELLALGPILHEHGVYLVSTSDQKWQIRYIISSILSEILSYDEFVQMISGRTTGDLFQVRLKNAFETLHSLKPFVNPDYSDLNWSDSFNHVMQDKALVSFLGDYTSPIFSKDQKLFCTLPPGANFILWSYDAIILSEIKNQESIDGQDIIAQLVTSPEVINEFITRKGGLPVIRTSTTEKLNACTQDMQAVWNTVQDKLHVNSNDWNSGLDVLARAAKQAWENDFKDIDGAVKDVLAGLNELRQIPK